MNRQLKKYIENNCEDLVASERDLKSVYEIMFRNGDMVLAEKYNGFKIVKYTYNDVKKMIESVSSGLYVRIGDTHGYVGLEIDNSVEWIAAFWGIIRSGNKPYLINMRHPASLSNGIISSLNIKYIVGEKPTKLNAEYIDIAELISYSGSIRESRFENEFAISTSASSLNEVVCFYKGYAITEQLLDARKILEENERMASFYHGSLKQLAFLPFYHIFGLFAVYFWFSFFGRTIVFLMDYKPDTILKTCRRHEVTHLFAVPLLWHTIEKTVQKELNAGGEKLRKKYNKGIKICTFIQQLFPMKGVPIAQWIMRDITDKVFGRSIRFCISGGSYIRQSALEMMNGIGYPMHNGYGMSEVGITSVELRNRPKDRNLNSIGKPFSSVSYRINDEGCLEIKGDSLCHEYMVNGEKKVMDEWFPTEDNMVCRDGYYYILGRKSDLVIGENGENINPDVIEELIKPKFAQYYSILGLGEKDNEDLSIVVMINKYTPRSAIEEMMQDIYNDNAKLPNSNRIKKFYFTYDPIVAETAIKVGRPYLIRGIKNGDIKLISFSDFEKNNENDEKIDSEIMEKVKKIFNDVLGCGEIDDNANLASDLNATSLQYFDIVSRISDEFEVPTLNEKGTYCSTPAEFCLYIERNIL